MRIEYDPELEQAIYVIEEIKPKVNSSSTSAAAKSDIIQAGGKQILDYSSWSTKRTEAATTQYEKIRNADDIKAVAKSSGFTIKEIQTIKNHVFYDKHIKYEGKIEPFDPDYDMAVAWKRLVEGTPKERDILLLKHELLESKLEKEFNLTAAEAHERANKTYAWDDKLLEELGEAGEDDDLL